MNNVITSESSSDSENFVTASSGNDSDATVVDKHEDQLDLADITYRLQSQLSITTMSDMGDEAVDMQTLRSDKEYRKLLRKVDSIISNVQDQLDEYPAKSCKDVDDINRNISKIETTRSEFREAHVELMDYISDLGETTEEVQEAQENYECNKEKVLKQIKAYVLRCHEVRSAIREEEHQLRDNLANHQAQRLRDEYAQRERTTYFFIDEIDRTIDELSQEFTKSIEPEDVSDEELSRRNNDLPGYQTRIEKLSKKHQQFLETIPEGFPDCQTVMQNVKHRYDKLITMKTEYETFIRVEVEAREILKENFVSQHNSAQIHWV